MVRTSPLTTLTSSLLSRTGPPILTGLIAEPDRVVDVSDRVIIFWTEPKLHDNIPRFQFCFHVPNTPVSDFLILDVSYQIFLGFFSKKWKKEKTVAKW